MIARSSGRVSRALGRGGGTSMPGKVLLAIRPRALAELAAGLDGGVALVSATNGKTTTVKLLRAAALHAGLPVVSNHAGANLESGVTTALLDGEPGARVGLFEVDEAALRGVVAAARPRVLVLMNLFRDQLDRYGELEALVARWQEIVDRLDPACTLVLNADDPSVASLARDDRNVTFFGVDDPALALPGLPHAADSVRCPRDGARLEYDPALLGHMGHWRCPRCGHRRPRPQVRATHVRLDGIDGQDLRIETPEGAVDVRLSLPGVHNSYNAAAAAAAALALGIGIEHIGPAFSGSGAAFGRAERVTIAGRELVILLAKNPSGANANVRTVVLDERPLHLLMALNDRTADGQDVSWIWDVDYEPLIPRIASITLTGDRAYDLALRFRYAGLDPNRVQVLPEPGAALDAALAGVPEGGRVYALPTYTAMLALRRVLAARGLVRDFWRDD
jgi:UDP-N-acetylmuramyl tripeptide synthase